MSEISKMDAFTLVVKCMDEGKEASANELFRIIVQAMKQEKKSNKAPSLIRIVDSKDEELFRDLCMKAVQ